VNEGEAPAQRCDGDVSAIFAVLVGQRGDQVIGDALQLCVGVYCCKICQLRETRVAQTRWVRQKCHARRDWSWELLRRCQCPRSCIALTLVEQPLHLSHWDFGAYSEQIRIIVHQFGSLATDEQTATRAIHPVWARVMCR
jgi:hypothetical protein